MSSQALGRLSAVSVPAPFFTEAYDPVLDKRKSQNAAIAKDLAQLLIADLRQGWVHHDDQPDRDRDIGSVNLKPITKPAVAGTEMADRHREEDPQRQEAVEEGQAVFLARTHR